MPIATLFSQQAPTARVALSRDSATVQPNDSFAPVLEALNCYHPPDAFRPPTSFELGARDLLVVHAANCV
jgi:hypothetical protein